MTAAAHEFKAVLFDLDGTLLDSLDDIASAANAVLTACGHPAHPVASYRQFIGDGVPNLFRRALPTQAVTDDLLEACASRFRDSYAASWNQQSRPYYGITALLEKLVARGLVLAVLSNKPHAFTTQCVDHYFPAVPFQAVAGDRPPLPRKPDPASALAIARQLGHPPRDFLYVGDSSVDMLTATRAGMYPVGVSWGFREVAELRDHGAKVILDDPLQLLELIDGPDRP